MKKKFGLMRMFVFAFVIGMTMVNCASTKVFTEFMDPAGGKEAHAFLIMDSSSIIVSIDYAAIEYNRIQKPVILLTGKHVVGVQLISRSTSGGGTVEITRYTKDVLYIEYDFQPNHYYLLLADINTGKVSITETDNQELIASAKEAVNKAPDPVESEWSLYNAAMAPTELEGQWIKNKDLFDFTGSVVTYTSFREALGLELLTIQKGKFTVTGDKITFFIAHTTIIADGVMAGTNHATVIADYKLDGNNLILSNPKDKYMTGTYVRK